MANRYWVGNGGNWTDYTNHWSATSGGSPGASTPTSSDNVYFDSNSFSSSGQTVTINATANCLGFDCNGATNNPTFAGSSGLNIYGTTFRLATGITWSKTNYITLKSTSTVSITTNSVYISSSLGTDAAGTFNLQDNYSGYWIDINKGTFNTNNHNITVDLFIFGTVNTVAVNLGSSNITCGGLTTSADSFAFDAGTSTITCNGVGYNFNGYGKTFYNVVIDGEITVDGDNTFNSLAVNAGKKLILVTGTIQTVSTFTSNGTAGSLAYLYTDASGGTATIRKTSGTVIVYYMDIQDIIADGGASFNALASVDSGNNTDIVFSTYAIGAGITLSSTSYCNMLKRLSAIANSHCYAFVLNSKLYIQDGNEYRSYDGTGVSIVSGYIPKISVATPYTGGGTPYENANLLTGKKHQTFNGDGTHATFQLGETSVGSVDSVYVAGTLKTVTTHYTVNITAGTVTFTAGNIPIAGIDNVDIYWTKGTGTRETVTGNKRSVLFGGANDSRVFMYGMDNQVIHSGIADGVPSAEYFPENNYLLIGSDEYDVTHLSKQYDRLIVHKKRDSHYCVYEWDATNGASFPTYPLNDSIGNIAFGEGQNILNNPFVITNNGVFQFTATNVRDEKNAVFTSQRVQVGLDGLDLSTAITLDWEKNYEYWVCVGKVCYVYNYKIDVWYKFELADTPTCFIEIDGTAYFGTSTGKIMKFDVDVFTDNGTAISSKFETGYMSFGANYIRKFLNFCWIGLQPQGKSKCSISWESDIGKSSDYFEIQFNLIDFTNIGFIDFSFQTSDSPKPKRIKVKVKKFTYLKLIGENNETTKDMSILNISLPVVFGGMSK